MGGRQWPQHGTTCCPRWAFLTLNAPIKTIRTEAASAGFYASPWGQHPRVQILTVGELLAGKKLDAPPRQTSRTYVSQTVVCDTRARVQGLGCRAVQRGPHPADVAVKIAVDFYDARGSRRSGFVACQSSNWRANGCLHAEVFPDPTAAKIATPV